MKSLNSALYLSLLLISVLSFSVPLARGLDATTGTSLTLHVTGVRNSTGAIRCAIYTSDNGWPEDKAQSFRFQSVPANGGTATLTFANIPAGRYAIAVFHDENENHKVDRDLLGRPKEGIGFANDPRIRFKAPSWDASSVNVFGSKEELTIHLRYP